MIASPGWMVDAACAELDGKAHFPTSGKYVEARSVCRSCVVIDECLRYALDVERGAPLYMRFGMWGGMTPEERVLVRSA